MKRVLEKINDKGVLVLTEYGAWEKLFLGDDLTEYVFEESEEILKYNDLCSKYDKQSWKLKVVTPEDLDNIDISNTFEWFTPEPYKSFNIKEWLIEQCKTTEELVRVKKEISLFETKNMLNLLRHMKYLIDFFRKNNILWGVGRGSSVASYCLYLIGVHRINSIEYDLPIEEFLR